MSKHKKYGLLCNVTASVRSRFREDISVGTKLFRFSEQYPNLYNITSHSHTTVSRHYRKSAKLHGENPDEVTIAADEFTKL
jgi:hypothetical protein